MGPPRLPAVPRFADRPKSWLARWLYPSQLPYQGRRQRNPTSVDPCGLRPPGCRHIHVNKGARENLNARRASFLSRAHDYGRYRPGYPVDAIRWVVGDEPTTVVDIGCGPGNLTSRLVELGHSVIGVDPSVAMLQGAIAQGLNVVGAAAEALPLGNATVDVLTAATAFHWFDHERAVPEMRRVLCAGGCVGLLTNMRDETVPWVKALSDIVGSEAAMAATLGGAEGMEAEFVVKLEGSGLFDSTEHRVFDFEQELTEEQLMGLMRSRSYISILPDGERDELLAEVQALCSEHPQLRDRESFLMPYKTHAFRATAS
ncbi:MAG: methyltransferase domain-containing protein [Actinobacteria bacterium]|nr:methyltransferase domain-containing protein [Actinomycetota bacterium]